MNRLNIYQFKNIVRSRDGSAATETSSGTLAHLEKVTKQDINHIRLTIQKWNTLVYVLLYYDS